MSLASALTPFINSKVRKRGVHYFNAGQVRVTACGPEVALAVVTGSSLYEVSLIREGKVLRATCSCPFAARGEACKHVWAALLAADAKGGLRGRGGTLPQRLETEAVEPDEPEDLDPDLDEWEDGDFEDGDFEDEAFPEETWGPPPRYPPARPQAAPRAPRPPTWRETMDLLARAGDPGPQPKAGAEDTEILYILDLPRSLATQELSLELSTRKRKRDGAWGKLRRLSLKRDEVRGLPDSADRKLLSLLGEARSGYSWPGAYYSGYSDTVSPYREIPAEAAGLLLPMLCATGRFLLRRAAEPGGDLQPLAWDDGEPWSLRLEARETADACVLSASLRRSEELFSSRERVFLLRSGFLIAGGKISALARGTSFQWVPLLDAAAALRVPSGERDEMLARLLATPDLPPLDLPAAMRIEETQGVARPRLRLLAAPKNPYTTYQSWPRGVLSFLYGAREVQAGAPDRGFFDKEERRLLLRDLDAERRSADRLRRLGFKHVLDYYYSGEPELRLAPANVPKAVRALLAEGWSVEAEGKLYRHAGGFKMGVSSGIDWFELHGEVEFEGHTVRLPELLAALRRGERFIALGDGSLGILPEEWLKKIAPIVRLGEAEGDHLRFQSAQAALLDAWLAEEPEATFDEAFVRARERLRGFGGVAPMAEPPGFSGELRAYQKAGLGWLHYLRDFRFGGCLADDMGLGKTIQVLALLEARRTLRAADGSPPSLIVVPRSLVFNWLAEAARFTPELRVLDHTGAGRTKSADAFADCDLVLTTYGTLRRDVSALRQTEFDYLILDEAQAIKNADSQTAKAARLLRGRHRLALTGTPIENHLGELWSLLEFLNPGLLGTSPLFAAEELRNPDPETCERLARGLRPFLLRRTKEQVAPELPAKVEQTLFCELPAKQRRLYDELRDHYRAALGARIGEQGLGRSKILVLEALLRLRQAACHPGLLDRARAAEPCAKLDLLLPQLQEILAEGHKALVFSQFTSFLALLREQLDGEGISYQYLDGRTRDRRLRVEAFQSDPDIRLFLISLKAGGLGLNLTAADYVYLLDPWWNPAVESQAIDRTHRIGQTRPVFACRIVARDTVEEKILELQKTKRDLADAVIQADQSLLAGLTREDLELLLS